MIAGNKITFKPKYIGQAGIMSRFMFYLTIYMDSFVAVKGLNLNRTYNKFTAQSAIRSPKEVQPHRFKSMMRPSKRSCFSTQNSKSGLMSPETAKKVVSRQNFKKSYEGCKNSLMSKGGFKSKSRMPYRSRTQIFTEDSTVLC
jgi:hypothetical protein